MNGKHGTFKQTNSEPSILFLLQAEQWLSEQAQSMGWAKAQKLQGRATSQGLVGLFVRRNIGALIEVNCETDFVAKNEKFKEFVTLTSKACVDHVASLPTNDTVSKIEFQGDSLKNVVLADGKTLADQLALLIGNVGENASLRRAICFKVADSVQLVGAAHPAPADATADSVQVGKYGSIVAFQTTDAQPTTADIPKKICQQLIGLNAERVGDIEKDKPTNNADNEPCLIYQEFLLDPSLRVDEFLTENKIKVLDFERFECGEEITANDENTAAAAAEAKSN